MKTRHISSGFRKLVLSAGIVPVHFTSEPKFLLLRSFRYWDFPKGIVEEGEDPLLGALRELGEETGITKVDFRWGQSFLETEPYSYGKVARYYVALVPSQEVTLLANPLTGRQEHEEFRWLAYAEARALLVPRVQAVLDWTWGFVREGSGTSLDVG